MFAFLFLSISFNKEYLRPLYGQVHFIDVLLGSYPNFIVAAVISLFSLKIGLSKNNRRGRIIFYAISFLVFLILTLEELIPYWGVSETFDKFDILASGLGCLLAVLIFELLAGRRKGGNEAA
jgi:hypothetical protein